MNFLHNQPTPIVLSIEFFLEQMNRASLLKCQHIIEQKYNDGYLYINDDFNPHMYESFQNLAFINILFFGSMLKFSQERTLDNSVQIVFALNWLIHQVSEVAVNIFSITNKEYIEQLIYFQLFKSIRLVITPIVAMTFMNTDYNPGYVTIGLTALYSIFNIGFISLNYESFKKNYSTKKARTETGVYFIAKCFLDYGLYFCDKFIRNQP